VYATQDQLPAWGVLQPDKSSTSKYLGFLFIERMTYFTIKVFFKAGVSRLVFINRRFIM
jgi:hypothetical protein